MAWIKFVATFLLINLADSTSFNPIGRTKRAASVKYYKNSPKASVYYMLDANLRSAQQVRECIFGAMKQIQQFSCVKFIDAKNRKAPEGLGLLIFTKSLEPRKCTSEQGLKLSQATLLVFGTSCGKKKKICLREILHGLGFQYEHQRPDRDKYIKTNITDTTILSSTKDEEYSTLTEYDISSVMHFDVNEFRNMQIRVESRDVILQDSIGSEIRGDRNLSSHRDKKALNILFQCSASCRETLECLHGGYMNKHCRCQCPSGFTGRFCESLAMSQHFNVYCGAVQNTTQGFIASPNFPKRYPRGLLCQWLIKTRNEYEKVEFKFERIDLEHDNMIPSERCKDTLRVWPHGTEIVTKSLSCLPEDVIKYSAQTHKTQLNWLLIEFRSDKWGQYNHSGFNISYRIIDDRPMNDRVAVRGVKESKELSKFREKLQNITDLNCYVCSSKFDCNRSLDYLPQQICPPMQACFKAVNEDGEVERRGCLPADKCTQGKLSCDSQDSDLMCSHCCVQDFCNLSSVVISNFVIVILGSILGMTV